MFIQVMGLILHLFCLFLVSLGVPVPDGNHNVDVNIAVNINGFDVADDKVEDVNINVNVNVQKGNYNGSGDNDGYENTTSYGDDDVNLHYSTTDETGGIDYLSTSGDDHTTGGLCSGGRRCLPPWFYSTFGDYPNTDYPTTDYPTTDYPTTDYPDYSGDNYYSGSGYDYVTDDFISCGGSLRCLPFWVYHTTANPTTATTYSGSGYDYVTDDFISCGGSLRCLPFWVYHTTANPTTATTTIPTTTTTANPTTD